MLSGPASRRWRSRRPTQVAPFCRPSWGAILIPPSWSSGIIEVVNEASLAVQLLNRKLTAHYSMVYEPRVTLSGQSIDLLLAYRAFYASG
jgi:hypothetical protein